VISAWRELIKISFHTASTDHLKGDSSMSGLNRICNRNSGKREFAMVLIT
jgi:hypothetical protein